MKILFLDDDIDRCKLFYDTLNNEHDITIVHTAASCIHKLKTEEYDIISLDHDLGGTVYAPSDEYSGYAVAKYIADNEIGTPVVIHSYNRTGATNMYDELDDGQREVKLATFGGADFWKRHEG